MPTTSSGSQLGSGAGSGSNPPNTSIPYVLLRQPSFDPRIRRLAQPFSTGTTPLQRGHMVWDVNTPWPPPYNDHQDAAHAPKILFLYNPSTVAASYSLTDASATAALIYPVTSVTPILRVPLQQQISFTIMFDRTYELNTRPTNPSTSAVNDPNSIVMQEWGVELDVACVKQFTGMFTPVYSDPTSGNSNDPLAASGGVDNSAPNVNAGFQLNGVNQGVMQLAMSYVYFGTPQNGLRFYGYIDSWDVQYTHFTQTMVPMRCVIDISFTLLPQPQKNTVPDPGAATTAANQNANPITGQTASNLSAIKFINNF